MSRWLLIAFLSGLVLALSIWLAIKYNTANKCPPAHKEESCTQSKYVVQNSWTGRDFIEGSNAFVPKLGDSTNGDTGYVTSSTDVAKLVSYTIDGHFQFHVENEKTTDSSTPRKSLFLSSKQLFDEGLFIFDIEHIPMGLTTWPAVWLTSKSAQKWPCGGEIDIIEQVYGSVNNQSTLHTKSGCIQPSSLQLVNQNCNANAVDCPGCCEGKMANFGCPKIMENVPKAVGKVFNENKGGVFAMEWTKDKAIRMWFWSRSDIPSDVLSNSPYVESWGVPYVDFNACAGHFFQMCIVINIALCGDWAGDVFVNGNDTGNASCIGYQKNKDTNSNYNEAFFTFRSIRVFNQRK